MADEQRDKFIERLTRIERDHAAGDAFAAPGTVGRVTAPRKRRPRIPVLRVLAIAVLSAMAMKIAIYGIGGGSDYDQRLEALRTQGTAGQTLAWVFQADPLTRFAGGIITMLMPR